MSDFNDILNDNAGYYAALGGLAGLSQRNRLLDTQNRQIQQQAQQHAEQSRQIAALAARAARVEAVESQRLEIEERRLEFETKRASDEQERREEIREMRRCLSKLITELEALPRVFAAIPKGFSPELTVRLATLQAACVIVTSRDIFEELSDMQALAQFDRHLGIFIAQKAVEGSTWADPAAGVVEEENTRFTVAQQAIKLLGDSSAAMQTLCAKPLDSFSKAEIENLRERITAAQKAFPPKLTTLEKQLRDSCLCFTANTKAQITVLHSMTGGGDRLDKLLSSANFEEADILGSDGDRGRKFVELKTGLNWAITECDAWKGAVDQAHEKLARVRGAAKAGNHKTAERLFIQAPQGVEGVDYSELYDTVSVWSNALARHELLWKTIEIAVTGLIANKSLKQFVSRFSLHQNCAIALSRYFEKTARFAQHAQALQECEYKAAALALIKHNDELAISIQIRARKAEAKHIITFMAYCIGVVVAAFSIAFGLSALKARQQSGENVVEQPSAPQVKSTTGSHIHPPGTLPSDPIVKPAIADYSALSIEQLQRLAEEEDPVALSQLSYRYRKGIEVKRDENLAFSYAARAAAKDYPYGLAAAAQMYFAGEGVEMDVKKGLALARRASTLGDVFGTYLVGLGIIQSEEDGRAEAIPWFKKAADAGCSAAMVKLGAIYSSTHKGVVANTILAMEYAKRAESYGDADGAKLVRLLETKRLLEKYQEGR